MNDQVKNNVGWRSGLKLLKRSESIAALLCIALILVLVTFSPYFFNLYNFGSLLTTIAPEGIVALGMMLLLITGVFDLSVGSVMCLGGLVAAIGLTMKLPIVLVILIALATGAVVGLINGLLIEVAGVNPLITTIGMMYAVRGITELTLVSRGKEGYTNFPESFLKLGQGSFLEIPYMFWILIVLTVVFALVIAKSRLGLHMYLIGGNESAAKAMGVNKKLIRICLFILVGILAALAGILLNARSGSANRYIGQQSHMNIIIACVIGGGSLLGGRGNMVGAVLGITFLALLNNFFNLFEINQHVQSLTLGIVLLSVVTIDGYLNIRKRRALGKE